MEQFDIGMITDHHYSGNIKIELRKCSDTFVKMSSQGATKQTKKKLYSTLGHLDCFDLAGFFPLASSLQGKNVPGISRCTLFFRQRGSDILNSDPKQLSSTPPSSSSICDRELFVSSTLPLGVCLPDTCPAWPSFSLISSVSVETCEGHLPISLCESLPARCLCQQFGD